MTPEYAQIVEKFSNQTTVFTDEETKMVVDRLKSLANIGEYDISTTVVHILNRVGLYLSTAGNIEGMQLVSKHLAQHFFELQIEFMENYSLIRCQSLSAYDLIELYQLNRSNVHPYSMLKQCKMKFKLDFQQRSETKGEEN